MKKTSCIRLVLFAANSSIASRPLRRHHPLLTIGSDPQFSFFATAERLGLEELPHLTLCATANHHGCDGYGQDSSEVIW
jgi:hypothetical protein